MAKIIAFLTRHAATPDQKQYFAAAGYEVRSSNKFAEAGYNFRSANDVVKFAQDCLGEGDELAGVVLVAPIEMVAEVLALMPNTAILRAKMERKVDPDDPEKVQYVWTGKFDRIKAVKIEIEEFNPKDVSP